MEPVNTIIIDNILLLLVDRKKKFCCVLNLGIAVFCVSLVHILVSSFYLLNAIIPLMPKDDEIIFHLDWNKFSSDIICGQYLIELFFGILLMLATLSQSSLTKATYLRAYYVWEFINLCYYAKHKFINEFSLTMEYFIHVGHVYEAGYLLSCVYSYYLNLFD